MQQTSASQQQQQRSSFYRANRPGNLNIVETNEPPANQLLSIQHQQSVQSPLINQTQSMVPPSPSHINQNYQINKIHPGTPSNYSNQMKLIQSNNNYSNSTSSLNNNQIMSPHYNQHQSIQSPHIMIQQQQNPPASPSYMNQTNQQINSFQTSHQYSPTYPNNNIIQSNTGNMLKPPNTPQQVTSHQYLATNSYDQQQSFTPKYSPCPSSAHINNKQAHYFNFDFPNINNMSGANGNNNNMASNQIPQSPSYKNQPIQLKQQQQQYQVQMVQQQKPNNINTSNNNTVNTPTTTSRFVFKI